MNHARPTGEITVQADVHDRGARSPPYGTESPPSSEACCTRSTIVDQVHNPCHPYQDMLLSFDPILLCSFATVASLCVYPLQPLQALVRFVRCISLCVVCVFVYFTSVVRHVTSLVASRVVPPSPPPDTVVWHGPGGEGVEPVDH